MDKREVDNTLAQSNKGSVASYLIFCPERKCWVGPQPYVKAWYLSYDLYGHEIPHFIKLLRSRSQNYRRGISL